MKDCTLVVSSCDKYSDLWDSFFKLLKLNWKSFDMPICLITDHKSFNYDNLDIQTYDVSDNELLVWGDLVQRNLKMLNTKYVLFMLDDFFIKKPVDVDQINQCLSYMEENQDIACFYLNNLGQQCINDNRYKNFSKVNLKSPYRFSTQAALWRRDRLIEFLRPHESAWHFETLGTKRSRRYHDSFYAYNQNNQDIINYDWKVGGVLHRGKWTHSGLETINKFNLDIDVSKRGVSELENDHSTFESKFKFYISKLNIKDIIRAIHIRYLSYKK